MWLLNLMQLLVNTQVVKTQPESPDIQLWDLAGTQVSKFPESLGFVYIYKWDFGETRGLAFLSNFE